MERISTGDNMKYGGVCCLGGNIKCGMLPLKESQPTQCLNREIYIWPAVNFLFEAGLKYLIDSVDVIFPVSGFIFVDFSWKNFRSFIDDEWVDYLGKSNMKIILLSDKKMASLAAYYAMNEPKISEVIYIHDDASKLNISLRKVFIGLPLRSKNVRSLTKGEKEILYLTLSNYSVIDISKKMIIDTKSVYNLRQRTELKLGVRIREFI